MAFLAVKKGCGGLGLAAVGDPALVGEVDAATLAMDAEPEASTRDKACVGSISLSTKVLVLAALIFKASKGMVTVLLVLVTLLGATEGLAGVIDAEASVGSTAETLSASSVPVAVSDCSAFVAELDAFEPIEGD